MLGSRETVTPIHRPAKKAGHHSVITQGGPFVWQTIVLLALPALPATIALLALAALQSCR
jgi:hypothetical protein